MSQVFLAYRSVDIDRAQAVRTKLEALGVPLFFDHKLVSGDDYIRVINEQLESASAVLVLWSSAAVQMPGEGEAPNFVLSEAERGFYRGILVAATFDRLVLSRLPVPFNRYQAPDVSDWMETGASAKHQGWQSVLKALGVKLKRPGLVNLAIALESSDDDLKKRFLKEYPDDPSAQQVAAGLEQFERKEFDARIATAKKRIQQRIRESEKKLKSCRDEFEAQIVQLRAGKDFMPPDPVTALDDNVATLRNHIEIYRNNAEEERAKADQAAASSASATAEVAALKAELAKATTAPSLNEGNGQIAELSATITMLKQRQHKETTRLILWSVCSAAAAALVFGFAGKSMQDAGAGADVTKITTALNSQIATLTSQNQTLQAKINTLQNAAPSVMNNANAALNSQIQALTSQNQTLQGQLTAAQGKADDAFAKNQALQIQLTAAQNSVTSLTAQDEALRTNASIAPVVPLSVQCDALAGYQFDPDRPGTSGYADSIADIPKAQAICRNALATSSGDQRTQRRILLEIGRLCESSGDLQSATQNWQKAANLGSGQAYFQLANYYANQKYQQSNLPTAWDNLKKSANADPANPAALYRLAYTLLFPTDQDNPLYGFGGDAVTGEQYLQKALSVDFNGATYYVAGVHYWDKNNQTAIAYLTISSCVKHYKDPGGYDADHFYLRKTKGNLRCP
jgi:chaperonin cofactor prefoldin